MKENLHDIQAVCRQLGITSRTLRFYEEKGIIQSTRTWNSDRRQYTDTQINRIRNVLVLRSIGLSVKDIRALQTQDMDLNGAILLKKAEIYASLDAKIKEINLLNEALSALESGGDVFSSDLTAPLRGPDEEREKIARICAESIVFGRTEQLYEHFSEKLTQYMPPEVYARVREDTLRPLGEFVSFDVLSCDRKCANILYQYVKYERLGLKIKFVFHGGKINGLWLNYYEL